MIKKVIQGVYNFIVFWLALIVYTSNQDLKSLKYIFVYIVCMSIYNLSNILMKDE